MIRLICNEQELMVSVKQAEAILHVQKESDNLSKWQLPEDSPYQLKDGKLIDSGRSAPVQGTTTKKRNRDRN
jgi:hypothetical protein